MARKKGNGEGSIFKNKKGIYVCQITDGINPSTGIPIRKTFYGKTKMEALNKKEDYVVSKRTGTYVNPMKMSLSEWLVSWLNTFKKPPLLSAKTFDRFESIINNHLIPSIGSIKLQDLKSEHIQGMYNSKIICGRIDGKGGLSAASIKYIHIVLTQALDKAVQLNYIIKNPEKYCSLPRPNKSEVESLSEEELTKIINTLNLNNTYDVAILMDIFTGIREGELVALRWTDVDFNDGSILINKTNSIVIDRDNQNDDITIDENNEKKTTKYKNIIKLPKTTSSIRKVPIPKSIIPILSEHYEKTKEDNKKAERNQDIYNLVFPSGAGTVLSPSNIRRRWERILDMSNVNFVKFHAIRHSFASLLLEKNENPKVIQLLLGHASLSTTMNIYVHATEEQKKNAMTKIDYLIDFKRDDNSNNFEGGEIKEQEGLYLCS